MILLRSKTKKIPARSTFFARFRSKVHRYPSRIFHHERRKSRLFLTRFTRTYHRLCSIVTLFIRLFLFFKCLNTKLTNFFAKIHRIFHLVHGWIRMIRSIFSALHVLLTCLMNFICKIYQIFDLLSILFEPFSNRSFEKAIRSFSHFLYDYYSSDGGCYTLKARTGQIIRRVRARWKRTSMENDEEIFYDALTE